MFAVKPSTRAVARVGLVVRASAQPKNVVVEASKKVQGNLAPAITLALTNAMLAMPALADEGAGKLFDFNLTLPVMVGQFLLLMVFLDKAWFTPVGKVLDERDEAIRNKLASVKGDSSELAALLEEADRVLKEARSAAQKAVSDAKSTTQAEQNEKLAILKASVDKELAAAMSELERERANAQSSVDSQVEKLSADILARVLPEGVTL